MPITQNFVWNYYAKDSVLWHWTLSTIKVCYLGHIMTTNSRDDRDIQREMHNMFIRTNMLSRRFSRCSAKVKLGLFTSYCLCLYDVGLWSNYAASTLLKFKYCYHKCIEIFFFDKSHSITSVLLDVKLPSYNTLIHNCRYRHHMQLSTSVSYTHLTLPTILRV